MPVFNSKQLVGRAVYKGIKVFAILPKKKKLVVEKRAEKAGIIKSNAESETTSQITEVHVSMLHCNYETSRQNVGRSGKVRKQKQRMCYIVKETYAVCMLGHTDVKIGN